MILEVAHLQIIPGKATDFEQAFARAQHIISAMPGYLGHQLQRALDDPHHYLLLVQWERLEITPGGSGAPPGTRSGRPCCTTSTTPSPGSIIFRMQHRSAPQAEP